MDTTTSRVLFRCASSIGQIVYEYLGWALKQITLYSWRCNQQPGWVLSWLPTPLLSCQVDTRTWSCTAEVRGPMPVIIKVAYSSHLWSTVIHFELFLFPPMFSSYAKFTFPPPAPSSSLFLFFDHWKPLQMQGHYSFWTASVFSVFPILTYFPILLQPLKYPSCCPTQFFDFLRWLPVSCQRQLWWLSPGTAQLAWQHVHEVQPCLLYTFPQHSARMGVFPAARQEMASAVSPQSAAHLKVLHSSTSRFFHWGKYVYCLVQFLP